MAPPSAPSLTAHSAPPQCCAHSASPNSTRRTRRNKAKPSCSDKSPYLVQENQWVRRLNVKHGLVTWLQIRTTGASIHARLVRQIRQEQQPYRPGLGHWISCVTRNSRDRACRIGDDPTGRARLDIGRCAG